MTKTFDAAEVIARLEALYPDRAPSPDATDRQVWMAVGAVEVVRWLRGELLVESNEPETVFPPGFETGREITRGREW